jgi:hypothetical protein
MRDEVREEVRQNSEQRQTRDAVGRQNPCSAAFMLPDGTGGSRGLLRRRDDRGPIFHAKTSSGKIVAQVRYASRLLRVAAKQHYLSGILPRIHAGKREKCDRNHSIYMQSYFHNRKIRPRPTEPIPGRSPIFLLPSPFRPRAPSPMRGIMIRVPLPTNYA